MQLQLKDVIIEEERPSRSMWRVGIEEFKERTVKFEVLKWESLKQTIFNRPVLVERMNDTVTTVDNEGINIGDGRSRRKAATSGVIKRKFNTKTY